jgi:hypothetical protein
LHVSQSGRDVRLNIVLQHWTGELDEVGLLSSANVSAYAESVGADYALLRGNLFRMNLGPPCQKLAMLDKRFDQYDQVLMLDMDMFAVKGLTENVFEVEGTGLFSEYTASIFARCRNEFPDLTDERFAYWGGAIYKFDLERRKALRAHIRDDDMVRFSHRFHDEGIVHRLACLARIPQDRMPDRWCQSSYLPEPGKAAMIHIRTKVSANGSNYRRPKIENLRALQKLGVL